MRILQVNKYGTRTSGADNYFLDVGQRLSNSGLDVAYLCMRPRDVPRQAEVFEIPDIDFHGIDSLSARLRAAKRVIWSTESQNIVNSAIDSFQPDVIHFHNYSHQLSSSVVVAANRRNIPTIGTAHDYKLICPAYTAVRDNQPCFQCAKALPVHCLTGKCLHESTTWSAVASLEALSVRLRKNQAIPGRVLAPSEYMAARLREGWLSGYVKTAILRNPVDFDDFRQQPPPASSPTGIYVGRLSREKAVDALVHASAATGVALRVVGDGPERTALEALATELKAPVSFTGHLTAAQLQLHWEQSSFFTMVPTWPENAPLSLLEALSHNLPAIVSGVGGLPEIAGLVAGVTVIPPRDSLALEGAMKAAAMGRLVSPDGERLRNLFGWDSHLQDLIEQYTELIS